MQGVRGRVGAAHRTAAFGLAALVVGTAVLGACGSSPRSGDDVLADAQAFAADASAFSFKVHSRTTFVMDAEDFVDDVEWEDGALVDSEDPPAGSKDTTTDNATTRGAWTTDAWESKTNWSYGRREQKAFGASGYYRDGIGGDDTGLWSTFEIPSVSHDDLLEEFELLAEESEGYPEAERHNRLPGASASIATAIFLGGQTWGSIDSLGDPPGLLSAIDAIDEAEVTSREDDSVTLVAELRVPADLEEAWGTPLPSGRATLTVGLDGVPQRLDLLVGAGGDSVELEIEFSDWNVPVEIERPADDEVDPTPWFDEEGVAAVPGIELLRPTVLPDGWVLSAVQAYPADDSGEGCDQVELYWTPSVPQNWGGTEVEHDYLSTFLLPVDCALDSEPTPFEVGRYAPLPSRESAYGTEVLVGDTVVQFDTTLEGRELAAIIESIAPTDLDTLAAEMDGNLLLNS